MSVDARLIDHTRRSENKIYFCTSWKNPEKTPLEVSIEMRALKAVEGYVEMKLKKKKKYIKTVAR